MRVFVYFNLHTHKWSVKALSGPHKGRVIAHADGVMIQGADCKVSEAGRQRVLRERRKNVHAGIVGRLYAMTGVDWRIDEADRPHVVSIGDGIDISGTEAVSYNPYYAGAFFLRSDRAVAVKSMALAWLNKRGVLSWQAETQDMGQAMQLPLFA